MKYKLLSILLVIYMNTIQSQSLDSLVDMAISQNKDILILDNEYKTALQKAAQVSQIPDTEVGMGGFPLPVQTRVGPQFLRLSATQMFPWFGTLDSKADLENEKAKVIREKANARALDIAFEIRKNYYDLYELRQSQSIINKNMKLLNSLERLAKIKVESGKSSASDVLRIQLRKEKLQQQLDILKSRERIPIIRINEWVERPLDTNIEVVQDFSFAVLTHSKDSLLYNISNLHPMIKMFSQQQEVAKKVIELNELEQKPSFGVGMDYIVVGKRRDVDIARNGRDIVQLRVMVKFPIQKKKYRAKEAEQKLKIEGLELEKENLLFTFEAMIEQGYAKYETARINKEHLGRQIPLIQSTINIIEGEYAAKGLNFDELLRLEMELIKYELNILKSIMKSHHAKNSIERFMIQ
ncbi:MAG: TolC family protein [Saprospiraceae bacterium]